MKILSSSVSATKTYQPKFEKKYMIQVAKTAFENPENLVDVNKKIIKYVHKFTKEISEPLRTVLTKLGIIKPTSKTISFLESPLHLQIAKDMEAAEAPSLHWFRWHIGAQVKGPQDSDCHSFYIFTKGDKDNVESILSEKNIQNTEKQISSFMENFQMKNETLTREQILKARQKNNYWIHAELDNTLSKTIGEPEEIFKIDDLSQLSKVLKELDY